MEPYNFGASETFILDVEDGIINLLAPLVNAGFKVGALPETKAGIDAAILGAQLWVQYRESTVDDENASLTALDVLACVEKLHYDVVIVSRGRRTDKGTYLVMSAARRLVFGQVPCEGANALAFTGARLEEFEEKGYWRYSFTVTTETVLVAAVSGEDGPLLQQVIFNYLAGQQSGTPDV